MDTIGDKKSNMGNGFCSFIGLKGTLGQTCRWEMQTVGN